MQRKVAWVNPEHAKAGKPIGVALNDTAGYYGIRLVKTHAMFYAHKSKASTGRNANTSNQENES